jgi:hypothetical protein
LKDLKFLVPSQEGLHPTTAPEIENNREAQVLQILNAVQWQWKQNEVTFISIWNYGHG